MIMICKLLTAYYTSLFPFAPTSCNAEKNLFFSLTWKLCSYLCSVLFIWAVFLLLHPLWMQQTCGSTQLVLVTKPKGRNYNKAAEEHCCHCGCCSDCELAWTQGPCLDAHDKQPCPTHLILLQKLDSVQLLHHRFFSGASATCVCRQMWWRWMPAKWTHKEQMKAVRGEGLHRE